MSFSSKVGIFWKRPGLFRRRSKEKNIPESILLRKEDLHGLTIDAARRRMQGLFKAFFVNRPAIFPASWKKGAYTGAPVFENGRLEADARAKEEAALKYSELESPAPGPRGWRESDLEDLFAYCSNPKWGRRPAGSPTRTKAFPVGSCTSLWIPARFGQL